MKFDRLLAITMLLLNRKRVSANELAERFEVSLRTVYRDMEAITMAGIPVVSYAGTNGGYEIMDQYRLERQFLSLEELQSIVVGLKGIRSSLDEQEIGGLLDKVGALIAKSEQGSAADLSSQFILDLNPWQNGTADKKKLADLRSAIRSSQLVRFRYTSSQSEESERTAEPMGVVLKGYVWYLYGYCRLRNDYRIFRLSRMKAIEVLPETFVRRPETLEQLDYRWLKRSDPAYIKLVLHVQPNVRARVEDYFQPEQIAVQSDGSLLVTAVQPEDNWMYGMLLSYGADLRILEPVHVAETVKEKAQQIVRLYS